jgi:hypothetical protein
MARRRRKRRFSLHRFWTSVRLPFIEAGAEWKRNAPARRRSPSRKEVVRRAKAKLKAEEKSTATPTEEMLREIEDAAGRKFRGALRREDPVEIGTYGLIRWWAENVQRRRKQRPPTEPQSYW